MHNLLKKFTSMILAFCLLAAGTAYSPATVSAAGYRQTVSKKVEVKSGDNISQHLIINVKKAANVTITVKAADEKSNDFSVYHGSSCQYCMKDDFAGSEMAGADSNGKQSVKLISFENESAKFKLSKGKHAIYFNTASDQVQNLKIIIKADKAVLKTLKWECKQY